MGSVQAHDGQEQQKLVKPKVYFYPGSRDPTIHEREGYVDCVPFSPQGMRWIEPTDNPEETQLFYCGQFHDKDAWRLNPNKFEFFRGRESKHILDIEGDWRGMGIPEWLRPCILTAMNQREKYPGWNIMARPGCSRLLVHLAREAPSGFTMPLKRRFWFQGQRDSMGLRERMVKILDASKLPSETALNAFWGAILLPHDPRVVAFASAMRESAFILCPAGEGQATLRMYEACCYGRIPIVIADCLWTWEDVTDVSFAFRISPQVGDEEMAKALADIFSMAESELEDRCRMAAMYFEHVVKRYFHDPTDFLLTWMRKNGVLYG